MDACKTLDADKLRGLSSGGVAGGTDMLVETETIALTAVDTATDADEVTDGEDNDEDKGDPVASDTVEETAEAADLADAIALVADPIGS